MSLPRRARRVTALALGLAATVAGAALAAPTTARADDQVGQSTTSRVTVVLAAPDGSGLLRLAARHGLSRAQRLGALTPLLPDQSVHARVTRRLRDLGLAVVDETAWTVTAAGTPASVAAAFGTRSAAGPDPTGPGLRRATGPLPEVPGALDDDVAAVFPSTGGPAVFGHAVTSTLTGPDFRSADAPAGLAPSTGAGAAGTTVATVQFADFHGAAGDPDPSRTAADLTTYAAMRGLADPVAAGRYRAVKVLGGPTSGDNSTGGDIEVDLDQQAILSVAPSANQHAYFAPNSTAGFSQAFASVLDDVTGSSRATLPDPHITTLSSSWGACESRMGRQSIQALEPILASLTAAGVTIFAAAGDHGIYDCGSSNGTGQDNSAPDVDYPGSSPSVVSVGGSRLSAPTSAPNTGTNWTETAWSCTSPVSCQRSTGTSGGTGGGSSGSAYSGSGNSFAGFASPSWQQSGIDNAPYAGATKRLVPDITAPGDPATGFSIYTSSPAATSTTVTVGGTSLASPVSAALLDLALADAGRTTGVGDIHAPLYAAYRATRPLPATSPDRVVRDVTSGSNGATAHRGSNPSVSAAAGYDTVSGVGAVLWKALVPALVAAAPAVSTPTPTPTPTPAPAPAPVPVAAVGAPVVRLSLTRGSPHTARSRTVTARWESTAAPGGRVARTVLGIRDELGSTVVPATAVTASGSRTFTAAPGASLLLSIIATDASGPSRQVLTGLQVPVDDRGFGFSEHWRRVVSPADEGGSSHRTTTRGAQARVTATGRVFRLVVHTGPSGGRLAVVVGGRTVRTLDLYSSRPRLRSVLAYRAPSVARRTLTLRATGTRAAASHGRSVQVDALLVSL